MPLFGRAIESITEQDLQRLIKDEVSESKSIDYKLELNIKTGDDKKELLKDITAFANTSGGHLLYGVDGTGAHPTALPGLAFDAKAQDDLRQRIENWLRDSVEPRLLTVQPWFVKLANGNCVLVLRVGQSWSSPHMLKDSSKFYGRNSTTNFQLDVQALRAAFAATEDMGRKMGLWRTERIGKILANEAPWTLPAGPRLIVHLMPQASFAGLRTVVAPQRNTMLPLLGKSRYSSRPNFDGWISLSRDDRTLTQLFRHGCLECADAYTLGSTIDGKPATDVRSVELEFGVTSFVSAGLATLQDLGVQAPVFACVTLAGIKGRHLIRGNWGPQGDPVPQDILVLPEAQVDDLSQQSQADVFALLRPVFDVLWQAFGNPESMNYDSNGEWRGS